MPKDDRPPRWRASYLILGAAGIVIATIFATVASLAVRPAAQQRPFPDMPGPVIADNTPTSSATVTTSSIPLSTTAGPTSTTQQPTSTTTSRKATTTRPTTTTTTPQAAPPPPPPPPPPKQKPVARMAVPTCNALACSFNGSGSSDPDGSVIYYAWSFGDGTGSEGSDRKTASHTYQAAGQYTVTLLVMDNDGQTHSTTRPIDVTAG